MRLRRSVWSAWLLAPLLVLVMCFWCQLHGAALGVAPVSFEVAIPWALKGALGWIVAGILLQWQGQRVLAAAPATRHPWVTRLSLVVAVVLITSTFDTWLLRGSDIRVSLWLYERLPEHTLFAALLITGWSLLMTRKAPVAQPVPEPASPTLIEVMTGTGRTHVRLDDIECLEADRNYINVHTPARSYLLRQTLSSFEKSLSHEFLRVHRSIIVNRARIRERRRGGVLVLDSGRTVRVSRAFTDQLN